MIQIVRYQDNDEFTKIASLNCDVRIIRGGDNIVKKFEVLKLIQSF